ncbi:MAG: DUF3667 domain-containing protein [Cytophagaceae bacterium]|nr:MAG: DUF3667 domain-containing protein [Cytophagaceae bacterium]
MMTATSTKSHGHSADGVVACLNCAHEFEGNFCNQCGQSAQTHSVDWHYIWHEIPHSVWHVDRGILFSVRELCTRPGYTIRDFIAGKRVNHYRPLALLLILGAIVAFVSHTLDVSIMKSSQEVFTPGNAVASTRIKEFQTKLLHFLEAKQTLLQIVTIPIYAFWFWFMFKRKGYNYPQILVAQTFITNFSILFSVIVTLIFWVFGGTAVVLKSVMGLSMMVLITYMVFVNLQLFRDKLSAGAIVIRTIVGYALGYLSFLVLAMLIGVSVGIYYGYQDARNSKKAPTSAQVTSPTHH